MKLASIKKFGADLLPVLFGILIAVALNNWRESVENEKYFKRSLEAIIIEHQENIKELDYAIGRQNTFADTLNKYYKTEGLALTHIIAKAQGFYTPDMKSITWRFLIDNSKHTLIPIEHISRLSEIDKYYSLIRSKNLIIDKQTYSVESLTNDKTKIVFRGILGDLMSLEKELIKKLQSFNEFIEAQNK